MPLPIIHGEGRRTDTGQADGRGRADDPKTVVVGCAGLGSKTAVGRGCRGTPCLAWPGPVIAVGRVAGLGAWPSPRMAADGGQESLGLAQPGLAMVTGRVGRWWAKPQNCSAGGGPGLPPLFPPCHHCKMGGGGGGPGPEVERRKGGAGPALKVWRGGDQTQASVPARTPTHHS